MSLSEASTARKIDIKSLRIDQNSSNGSSLSIVGNQTDEDQSEGESGESDVASIASDNVSFMTEDSPEKSKRGPGTNLNVSTEKFDFVTSPAVELSLVSKKRNLENPHDSHPKRQKLSNRRSQSRYHNRAYIPRRGQQTRNFDRNFADRRVGRNRSSSWNKRSNSSVRRRHRNNSPRIRRRRSNSRRQRSHSPPFNNRMNRRRSPYSNRNRGPRYGGYNRNSKWKGRTPYNRRLGSSSRTSENERKNQDVVFSVETENEFQNDDGTSRIERKTFVDRKFAKKKVGKKQNVPTFPKSKEFGKSISNCERKKWLAHWRFHIENPTAETSY